MTIEKEKFLFGSTVLILPGLGNSGEQHWQTHWEKQFDFIRLDQQEWEKPNANDWVITIEKRIASLNTDNVILVGHSLACATIVLWSSRFNRKIKGALLVAPSDTEASSYPLGTIGFTPMPLNKLPFPSITITSGNDFYVTLNRARFFAQAWGSTFVNIGEAGHINTDAGFGEWPAGLEFLKELEIGAKNERRETR